MVPESQCVSFSFVWRSSEITSAVIEQARHNGVRALFDLTQTPLEKAAAELLVADATGDCAEVRLSIPSLQDNSAREFMIETGLERLWINVDSCLGEDRVRQTMQAVSDLNDSFTVIPIVSDPKLAQLILGDYPAIGEIALKGSEASGLVGSETAFSMFSWLQNYSKGIGRSLKVYIWGSVARPELAAAFVSAGASGIVFESIHWCTDLVEASQQLKQKISGIRLEHTDLVGGSLGVSCRLYNKGNSRAVKALRDFTATLCSSDVGQVEIDFFTDKIDRESIHALESELGREELIPLGVEVAFAGDFVNRYGSDTEKAISAFVKKIKTSLDDAGKASERFVNSSVAAEMGTTYPFIQGAMSWITDVPEFALMVAKAGALPTVALGLMNGETLSTKLASMSEVMDGRPFAVNVITLMENPYRSEQLEWIESVRPRFAVIAAGEPSHAAQIKGKGIEPIYIAPNEDLMKLALELGVSYVVLEGAESGGHVGVHSTMTLAQMCLAMKEKHPELFLKARIILAGGIFDRLTAFMAAMVGADAIQMGTCYLACNEIVETGALSRLYQQVVLDSEPGSTVVTGAGVGLRVRSIKTSRIEQICDLERDYLSGKRDEKAFRSEIETLSAGSLFVAAKAMDKPGGDLLDDPETLARGQFMSGACCGSIKKALSLEELHARLAIGSDSEKFPVQTSLELQKTAESKISGRTSVDVLNRKVARIEPKPIPKLERIAITGMSLVNSLGNSVSEIWEASVNMRCGITEIPFEKWDHTEFYNPRPRVSEKTYCRFGAFQNLEVDRKELGIPPQDFRTMADATRVTMWLAHQAIGESGILDSGISPDRISVLISQNAGEAASTLDQLIIRGSVGKIIKDIKRAVSLTPEQEAAVASEIRANRLAVDDTTLLGRLNCSAGGFICNKYGFMGPSFSVSAACATSLVALYTAFQLIRNGTIDAAVIGGAEELITPLHFLEFSALGALAGLSGAQRSASEASRPFDADRDGMVLGEGGGMLVIERESVALRRGARIHAFITGMGAGNNNRGMVESSRVTQIPAIKASFESAGYGPETVQLVECHATSTKQGDIEEVHALRTVYGSANKTWLSSFKSQIGHTLGASGVNSLVRGVMAMKNGVIPPTLNFQKPDSELDLETSPFQIATRPEDWPETDGRPRRFQVNAFGFGGSNYVVQLEQNLQEQAQDIKARAFGMAAQNLQGELPEVNGVVAYRSSICDRNYRIAVVAESEEAAERVLSKNEICSNGDNFSQKRLKALAKQGIFVGESTESSAPLAFVFPGQGSHYAGMGLELYNTFPVIRHWMNRAAEVAEFDILKLLFYDKEEDLQKTRWQQPALFTLEYAMVKYLTSLGVTPTAMAGHSLGELTALCLAGVYSFEDGFRLVNKRAICMDKACSINIDPGVMMACDAPMEIIEELRGDYGKVYITNINSPHQIVLGGDTNQVKDIGARLKELGHRSTLLRVSMAFHSPIMACIHDELEEFVAGIEFHPPQIPVISNTTMAPFTSDTYEIKKTVMAHLESCVNWMPNVKSLWNDFGIRMFVEVGPREILTNLILDTIPDAECVQTCLPSAEAMMFRNAVGQLYSKGQLELKTSPTPVKLSCKTSSATKSVTPSGSGYNRLNIDQSTGVNSIERIVQREISSFVFQSFGRFIKPSLLESVRREIDPSCSESELDAVLSRMFSLTAVEGISVPPVSAESLKTVAPLKTPEVVPVVIEPQDGSQSDIMEQVIQIIMDVTGYERDEIEPGMDLREDLSIRSSRLPVIMDAVESQFKIKVELEEFMDVRTVKDMADRISSVVDKISGKSSEEKPQGLGLSLAGLADDTGSDDTVKRLVFKRSQLSSDKVQPVELSPMDSVVVLSPSVSDFSKQVGDVFRRDYGVNIIHWNFLEDSSTESYTGSDLRTSAGAEVMSGKMEFLESVSGLALVMDHTFNEGVRDLSELGNLLTGYFLVLKQFLESKSRKLAFTVRQSRGMSEIFQEGIQGMFLTGALEFSSVQFRSVILEPGYELRTSIRAALDRNFKPLKLICSGSEIMTESGFVEPIQFDRSGKLPIHNDEVIVISGGCSGITSSLAEGLGIFGPKIVFIGRTDIDSGNSAKAIQTLNSLEHLNSKGIFARYYKCDVTDAEETKKVFSSIVADHGKITGVIHGAGYLKDSFVKQMPEGDFRGVVDVKYMGSLNLFRAVEPGELKFFVNLSSVAAVQGNPGQINYSAGNRMMSALAEYLGSENPSIKFKSLELPPIEGAGMADNEEIRSLMERMNAKYISLGEFSSMFLSELTLASNVNSTVLFMKSLPCLSTAPLETSMPENADKSMITGTVSFKRAEFPMIDSVTKMDVSSGIIEVERVFDQGRDLWIADHKPFKFLDKPLVSAIMALETFMETAQMMYPALTVRGARDAKFLDRIEVGSQDKKKTRIHCARKESSSGQIILDTSLTEISSMSEKRIRDKSYPNYKAMIILDSGVAPIPQTQELSIGPDELDTVALDKAEIGAWYDKKSDLKGRYRVVEMVEGTGDGAIKAQITYPECLDFKGLPSANYVYSPYLFEAFMHVINFYGAFRKSSGKRGLIPFGIGELTQFRKCNAGDKIIIEARRTVEDEKGVTWNARGVDQSGALVMFARDVTMRWFHM